MNALRDDVALPGLSVRRRRGPCSLPAVVACACALALAAPVAARSEQSPPVAAPQVRATPGQTQAARDAQARAAALKVDAARIAAEAAFFRAARASIAHGKRADAESMARSRGAGDAAAAAILGRLAVDRGQYDAALAILEAAATIAPLGEAALELGLLQRHLGRSADAARTLAPLMNSARGNVTGDGLLRAARAAHALDQTRTANSLYRDASAALKNDPAVNTAWGTLFREKHTPAEAVRSFRIAIEADANWAPAHAGLARALENEDPVKALGSAAFALSVDPALADAHLFQAEAALDADNPAAARVLIDRVLAINPRSPEAHTLLAAMAWVAGRTAEYEAEVARALAVNPARGDTYRVIAAHTARNYRFDEAVSLGRKAIALEPTNIPAYAELGMHLMRAGDERDARRMLDAAYRGDPYDAITLNLLRVLDTLDGFESQKSGAATIRMHPDEAPVLRLYAGPLAAKALAEMRTRYGIDPKGEVTIQIFPKHDDFAVRTTGLMGMVGALGASFGSVVTQDSPRARPPGSFNWQATMWHELAHVFTLQLSNQRVPRWVTEGISVYEEGLVDPSWARDSELSFAHVYGLGKVLKLAELNSGFTRPELVSLAYFQSSLVVSLIVERHGFEALREMVRAFADGADVETALLKGTKTSLADLQKAFDATLEQRYGAVGTAMRVPDGVEMPRGGTVEAWTALAAKHAGSYPVQIAAGQALGSANAREAAIAAYERAAALVPFATGAESPRARIADLAERGGDLRRALRELSSLVADDHTNIDAARKLAQLARRLGDGQAAALAWNRIVVIDPFDAAAHTALGRIAVDRKEPALALREFRAALASGPADPAPAHCDLAEALLMNAQRADAKKEVLAALEIAPTYERAQELLLRIIDGKG
jgi:tetratricopeptide (TPR) repeat protein